MTIPSPLASEITRKAFNLGFDLAQFSSPEIPAEDRDAYDSWRAAGYAGEMAYMVRDPQARKNVTVAFPEVKTVLVLGLSYYQGSVPPKPGPGYGRLARYAWGLDYHDVILHRLNVLMGEINRLLEASGKAALAVDTQPVLERALAKKAGLGFIGKNTVLISPRQDLSPTGFHIGSYVFLAEVFLNVDLEIEPTKKHPFGCGSCRSCLKACPPSAFEGPFVLNANKCISYLSIENKGWIARERRPQMGDWIFGCDLCQVVCPYNTTALTSRWPEFSRERGVGPWIALREVLTIPDTPSFKKKFGHTPLLRSKRKGLMRNACVVSGNSGDESLIPLLSNLMSDAEPLIRGHALWALSRLTSRQRIRPRAEAVFRNDPDRNVRDEARHVLETS